MKFRLGGCKVRVGFTCFVLLAACCLFSGLGGGGACAAAVMLHEGAHLAMMWLLHTPPESVALTAMGCRVSYCKGISLSNKKHALISLAGPGMNWLCFLLSKIHGIDIAFTASSLALGILHSLPIEPLDGGLALRYFLMGRLGPFRAEKVCRLVSAVILFPLAALGFMVLLRTRYNYSLLALSMYLMLYLVLGWDYTQV